MGDDLEKILSQYSGRQPELRAGSGPSNSLLGGLSDMFRNKLQGPSYFDDAASVLTRLLNKPSASQNLAAWEYNRTPPMPNEGQQNILGRLLSMVPENVLLASNFIGPGVKPQTPAPKPQGIKAYHGSPHDFDQFSLAHIGKGEGAQAFGHGLYFAENEGVAKGYRKALAGDAPPVSFPSEMEARAAAGPKGDVIEATNGGWRAFNENGEFIRSSEKPGKLYEVNIKADPEHFLDWDKPLSQQSEKVRQAFQASSAWPELVKKQAEQVERLKAGKSIFSPTPERIAEFSAPIETRKASELMQDLHLQNSRQQLLDAGIPGIKYLDQGSRADGAGSRNYVVFDDKLIEILRKYGLMPPAVAAGAAALGQSDQQ